MKLIPVEMSCQAEATMGKKQKQKYFNPGHKIKKQNPLKGICLRLVHFINRGTKFTYEQIDDLIMSLQHVILNLQRTKQEILRNKTLRLNKRKRKF